MSYSIYAMMIKKSLSYVDWNSISYDFNSVQHVANIYPKKLNWIYISHRHKLSEEFIIKYQDYVNWNNISIYQNLSEDFLKIFRCKLNWHHVLKHQELSPHFKYKIKQSIDLLINTRCKIVFYYNILQ